MNDNAETASSSSASLQSALLDYFSAPGKYQLTLRQPAVLFSSIREILQIAAGRGANGAATAADAGELREAAMFFIRAALLYPGADHYAVLGVPPNMEAADLKERYRLLMRLIHPDFATAGSMEWPADAAVRVNRAYEVLSSSVLRREYDEQLASLKQQRPSLAAKAPPHMTTAAMRRAERAPARMGRKTGWALGLLLAGLAVFLLLPRQEPDHLVQRPTAMPAERIADARVPGNNPAGPHAPITSEQQASTPTGQATERQHQPMAESVAPPAAPLPASPVAIAPPATVSPPAAAPVVPPPPAAVRPAPVPPPVAARAMPAAPASVAARPVPLAHPAKVADRPAPVAAAQRQDNLRAGLAPVEQATVPPPAPLPPPVVASASPPPAAPAPVQQAPVAIAATASAATSAVKPAAIFAVSTVPSPTLSEAQPLLTQVLQMLETGSGEQLLRLLDPKARQAPAAQELSRSFEQMVRGARPVRLTQVEFKGEPRDGVLLVTGRIRLHAGEPTIGSYGQKLVLRAEFASRGGHVMLTGLSGSPD